MSTRKTTRLSAAVLSLALMFPTANAFAATRHNGKRHHYSRTRGTLVGAAAGALIGGRKNGVKGAVIGGAIGNAVQYERDKKQ